MADKQAVNEAVFSVMACKAIKSVSELNPKAQYILEPKLDGFRLIAYVLSDRVEFYTRAKKKQDGKLPHIEKELLKLFPPGTVLDGEVVALKLEHGAAYFHGTTKIETLYNNDFEYVQSVMLSKPERSVQVQEKTGFLQYLAFDIISLGAIPLMKEPLRKRRELLSRQLSINAGGYVSQIAAFNDVSDQMHELLVAHGFEGSVIKDLASPYVYGARGAGWFKIKDQPTVDCVVMGYQAGTGKFAGLVGAVFFGQPDDEGNLKIRGKASGMDDEERKYMTDHQDELMGTVIEIAHMGIFPNGVTMRHPQFKRFRPDRRKEDITWHNR